MSYVAYLALGSKSLDEFEAYYIDQNYSYDDSYGQNEYQGSIPS